MLWKDDVWTVVEINLDRNHYDILGMKILHKNVFNHG